MSRKLNGAEVLKLILEGKVEVGDKFKRVDLYNIYTLKQSFLGTSFLQDELGKEVCSSRLLNGTFELVEKPVSFDEVLNNSDKRVRVDIDGIGIGFKEIKEELNEYDWLSTKLEKISSKFFSENVAKIIKEAKWYIER